MTRRLAILLVVVASLGLGLTASAGAHHRHHWRQHIHRLHPKPRRLHAASVAAPTIKSVSPLKANVGEKLTILGKNFLTGKKTRVFFLRQGGGLVSTLPEYATHSRLVVAIPDTLTPLLRGTGKTRFQIRLLTKRYGDPTKMTKSPLIGPASTDGGGGGPGPLPFGEGDCDHDGIKNKNETDSDNDLIPDATESAITHTDPCKADTDGDGVSDGYEWQSAKDENNTTPFNVPDAALPYPGKKPWPNPLDPTDTGIDHDGDGLTMADEYQLFKYYGHNKLPLNYSDGLQASQAVLAPSNPVLRYQDINHDGVLTDDERDADGDGLGNWDERYGRMTPGWWDATYNGQHNEPLEKHYPNIDGHPMDWIGTSMVDPDTDGDHVPDGQDDQDHDGLSNAFELERPSFPPTLPEIWKLIYVSVGPDGLHHDGNLFTQDEIDAIAQWNTDNPTFAIVAPNPWARVQPYNPCKPVWSKTCHLHAPLDYYPNGEDWQGADPRLLKAPPAMPWMYKGEN